MVLLSEMRVTVTAEYYKITNKNKKASEVMHKYMIDISKCVKAEFKDNIKQLKTQLKEMNGGVK